jgi:predicted signal transduction protein with EAL and GGDEF domain
VPLLYGLLLINSMAVATHRTQAPIALTVSVPAVLFTVSVVRMIHWFRASRNGMTTPAAAKRQLQLVTLVAAPIAGLYRMGAFAGTLWRAPLNRPMSACIFPPRSSAASSV